MPLLIVMGVSGAGKSTVAALLAAALSCTMLEGDSLHSPENIARMSRGIALGEADRAGWLDAIADALAAAAHDGHGLVVACSALTHASRDRLRRAAPRLRFVYLAGDREVLAARLKARRGHFMPPELLDSQLRTLEVPDAAEHAILCPIGDSPAAIVNRVLRELRG